MIHKLHEKPSEDCNTFGHYKIVSVNNKYGIETTSGTLIVDPVFDNIYWHKEDNLIEFRLENKYAICKLSDLPNLRR